MHVATVMATHIAIARNNLHVTTILPIFCFELWN